MLLPDSNNNSISSISNAGFYGRQLNRLPRALHVVQSLAAQNGGTSVSVPAIAGATASTGRYINSLIHFGPREVNVPESVPGMSLIQHPASSMALRLPTRSRAFLAEAIRDSDVIQIHGIWTGHCSAALTFASRFRKPVIVSAHGMLDGWALRHKRWKKAPYSKFVERPGISRATCLGALTSVEAGNYREFGLNLPIAVIPNGVVAPENTSSSEFLEKYPGLRGKKILLFLGRVHKKKGVDLLVKAWEAVSSQLPGAHLVIAGPDDGALPPLASDSITVCGMLTGSLKWSALAASSAFTLPSFSEGLSNATLEALWQGVPVMITRECNFREVEALECTFLVEPSVESIIEGLKNMLTRSSGELQARGKIGAEFVRARYAWSLVGQQMADVYDWMGGGPRPSSMEI